MGEFDSGAKLVDAYHRLASLGGIPTPFPLDAQSVFAERPGDSRWGEFHAPNPLLMSHRNDFLNEADRAGALKVSLFGSFYRGLYVLDDILRLEELRNDIAVLTGLCTDGVSTSDAKVSVKKRVWQYIPEDDREAFVSQVMNLALDRGVPVFTGSVKTDLFHNHVLPEIFSPDVILMATFGQLIDDKIFKLPRYGMYNFHPSDLARGKFPGPNPFSEMLDAGETHTRMTIHWVDGAFDTGRVVGFSPEISIELEDPSKWSREEHIVVLHKRTSQMAGLMARRLLFAIRERQATVQEFDFESYIADECLTPESLASIQSPIAGVPGDHFPHRVLQVAE